MAGVVKSFTSGGTAASACARSWVARISECAISPPMFAARVTRPSVSSDSTTTVTRVHVGGRALVSVDEGLRKARPVANGQPRGIPGHERRVRHDGHEEQRGKAGAHQVV